MTAKDLLAIARDKDVQVCVDGDIIHVNVDGIVWCYNTLSAKTTLSPEHKRLLLDTKPQDWPCTSGSPIRNNVKAAITRFECERHEFEVAVQKMAVLTGDMPMFYSTHHNSD